MYGLTVYDSFILAEEAEVFAYREMAMALPVPQLVCNYFAQRRTRGHRVLLWNPLGGHHMGKGVCPLRINATFWRRIPVCTNQLLAAELRIPKATPAQQLPGQTAGATQLHKESNSFWTATTSCKVRLSSSVLLRPVRHCKKNDSSC